MPVLALLRARPGGAIVVDLAAALGASVGLVERRLRLLRDEGLVTAAPAGPHHITTWRAAPPSGNDLPHAGSCAVRVHDDPAPSPTTRSST